MWPAGDPPPREGCSLDVLIDGAQALPLIAEAIDGARESVHLAGWHVTPGFGLTRDDSARPLRDLLSSVAERADVRVLLWAGAPVPLFTPKRSDVRAVRDELVRGTRIRCALDARERPMHCHHEKLVIVDGEVAFVGGIDLTSLAGDRFDGAPHHVRGGIGWHDVGTRLRGPAVADVAAHFVARWEAVTGERLRRPAAPAERRLDDGPGRPHRAGEDLRLPPARRLPDPRGVPARAALGPVVRVPREPVPLVAGDRPRPRGQAAQPAIGQLPARGAAARAPQRRRRRHARPALGPGRRRRRRGPVPRHHGARSHGVGHRAAVRAREGGDRR